MCIFELPVCKLYDWHDSCLCYLLHCVTFSEKQEVDDVIQQTRLFYFPRVRNIIKTNFESGIKLKSIIMVYRMSCNEEIHDEFKNMGEFTFPFCGQQLEKYERVEKNEMCCDDKELICDNETHICRNCGVVDSCDAAPE